MSAIKKVSKAAVKRSAKAYSVPTANGLANFVSLPAVRTELALMSIDEVFSPPPSYMAKIFSPIEHLERKRAHFNFFFMC